MQTVRFIIQRILATLTLFTRLPFWRLCNIEAEHYKHVTPLWPLAGWLTGGLMMGLFYLLHCLLYLPLGLSLALCLVGRTLLTGALHEDGFADFCDGFGGGTSRERILQIMKDSHIGTYGVLGLIGYYLIFWNLLIYTVDITLHFSILLVADCCCKMVSSMIVRALPYARKEEEAKIQTVYERPSVRETTAGIIIGLLPMLVFPTLYYIIAAIASAITAILLFRYMRHRIGGYTGDCCGATFIITEAVFHLTVLLCYALG